MFTSRFRLFFYSTLSIATYTGFVLTVFMVKPADFFPLWRQAILKIHIASVVLWLFTCGMLFSMHVFPQLQAKIQQGRRTGLWLVGLIIAMTASGFALQIFALPSVVIPVRWLHTGSGTAFVLVLVFHLLLIRAEIRAWVIGTAAVVLLLVLPYLFLEAKESYPDEFSLTPQGNLPAEKKTP